MWCISFGLTPAYIFDTGTSSFCVIWPDGSVYAEYPNHYTTLGSTYWTYDLLLFMNFAIFLFLMIFNNVLYIKIYLAVKGRNNNDLGLTSSSDLQHRQVANMLIVNGVFFFLCVSFQIFMAPVSLIYKYMFYDFDPLFIFTWGLIIDIMFGVNACINPIIYLITNTRYSHSFVKVFTWSRNNSQNKTEVNTIKLSNINQK